MWAFPRPAPPQRALGSCMSRSTGAEATDAARPRADRRVAGRGGAPGGSAGDDRDAPARLLAHALGLDAVHRCDRVVDDFALVGWHRRELFRQPLLEGAFGGLPRGPHDDLAPALPDAVDVQAEACPLARLAHDRKAHQLLERTEDVAI